MWYFQLLNDAGLGRVDCQPSFHPCFSQKAIELVKKKNILEVIKLTHEVLLKLRQRQRIAVAGLNPHAGEDGAFEMKNLRKLFLQSRRRVNRI